MPPYTRDTCGDEVGAHVPQRVLSEGPSPTRYIVPVSILQYIFRHIKFRTRYPTLFSYQNTPPCHDIQHCLISKTRLRVTISDTVLVIKDTPPCHDIQHFSLIKDTPPYHHRQATRSAPPFLSACPRKESSLILRYIDTTHLYFDTSKLSIR